MPNFAAVGNSEWSLGLIKKKKKTPLEIKVPAFLIAEGHRMNFSVLTRTIYPNLTKSNRKTKSEHIVLQAEDNNLFHLFFFEYIKNSTSNRFRAV